MSFSRQPPPKPLNRVANQNHYVWGAVPAFNDKLKNVSGSAPIAFTGGKGMGGQEAPK